ncbi:hypothetical protein [Pseudomonas synxantha]|uniref:Uncharacterized protein n=1 Tax=Pseudomonas synxantha TaxID=47883 RepID=A0AAU8TVA6_9PSED|nr:hypothetical protein [Pseudomonas synxantha]AKA86295.1 hypothetical protein VO64_5749 [Pseudomonas synxantha]
MSDSPTALGQLPSQAVHAHFATRPALFSVVFKALRTGISERYPNLQFDLLTLKLASPTPSGGYAFPLLAHVALDHVLNPQLLDLSPRGELPYYLSPAPGSGLADVDMQVIAQVIDELRASLYLSFQQDLADYWSQADSHGRSRWQWLGEFLQGQMTAAAVAASSLSDTQRDMLAVAAAWPGRLERLPRSTPTTYAYFIQTTLARAAQEVRLLTPDLLLIRDKQVLLCGVAGAIEAFDSLDAFGQAWSRRLQRQFQFDSLTWRRNEPNGNLFEQQAGLILNQQLDNLAAVDLRGVSEAQVDRRLDLLTDPAMLFLPAPAGNPALMQQIGAQLPGWLRQADADDRFAYHLHLQQGATVLRVNQRRSYNEGIENLHDFSRAALRKQMQADHGDYDPDDVLLDFAVAAGYPGGAGIIDHVRLSLTELAVKNLAGKPKGTLTLSSKNGGTLPPWLTDDYVLGSSGLIQRVDIGTAYPQTIKDLLLSDSDDARRREQLFTRELKVQLPRMALEFAIRQQYGVTTQGYRYVNALMGETPNDRIVDGQEIVLRPLALCRKAGATPDTVNNVFIIEPRDASIGPHLLYRPLYTDALYQYPTRQALLEALAAPGDLQASVLTWLSDKARPIYAHGGIKEPHIIRFLAGDEFAIPDKPEPATLAVDEGAEEWLQSQVNGQLLSHLFGSTARALVELADRESVSNSESRWAIVMEGAWLLFNTLLLPLTRGPAMLAGWFLVLVGSLQQDLAGLDSRDPTTRELALIDLLLNTAMVLLHAASPSPRTPPQAHEDAPPALAAWRRPAHQVQAPAAPQVRHGEVALPGEPPATGLTPLDFSRSIASPQAGAKLLKLLLDLHVPWPDPLPVAQASGPFKGLYRIGETWHASLGGLLFQVSVVPGFGEVYLVDPQHPLRPGFKLTGDGQGHWRLERKARLEGGMPRERRGRWERQHRDRLKVLEADLARLNLEFLPRAMASLPFKSALDKARVELVNQKQKLREDWLRLRTASEIPGLQDKLAARHEQRRAMATKAKLEWDIAFERYQKDAELGNATMQQIQDKGRELMEADNTDARHKKTRNVAARSLYDYWGSVFEAKLQKFTDILETDQGENAEELFDRVNRELPEGIPYAYQMFLETRKLQIEALREMLEPAKKIETTLKQADPELREFLLKEHPEDQYLSAVTVEQNILMFLAELVLDRTHGSRSPAELPFIKELTDPKNTTSVLAHTEMRTTSGYSTSEQIEVLKSALERYERMENAVNALTDMGSGFVREAYRTEFLDQLVIARTSLEAQLADVILTEEGFAHVPSMAAPTRPKPASRRVFKTRKHMTLVGDLRPADPAMPGSFVDIKDPLTGQTVATYHEHVNEGVWAKVDTPKPSTPSTAAKVRALKTIRQSAETVMAQRAGIERTIRAQQRKLQDPARRETLSPLDWDDMLSQHARKIEALAEEIERDHASQANAAELIKQYRDEAASAQKLAREVCAEGYKRQLPKASNVAYLWRHGFVDINLAKSREPLAAGDFLSEYAVYEKGTPHVLWYAHFHYPTVQTPAAQHSFGHLKLPAERLLTRKQLIERAVAENRAVVNLDKATIRPPLDKQLFLDLEPPRG